MTRCKVKRVLYIINSLFHVGAIDKQIRDKLVTDVQVFLKTGVDNVSVSLNCLKISISNELFDELLMLVKED